MPLIITWLLLLFILIYLFILGGEWIANRSFKKILPELLLLSGFLLLLHLTTGFPSASYRQSFGSTSPLTALGLMFICTMLGIMAHYIFYLKGKFSWKNLLKPLVVSPIVFLPLIGSVQSASGLESIQMITFAILAFQNGFFWKEVLTSVKEKL